MLRGMGRTVVRLLTAAALLATAACASARERAPPPLDWRTLVTDADRTRIRTWRDSFVKALTMARATGDRDAVDAQGQLLRPDAALGDPMPPPGAYRCRVIRLGATAPGQRDFLAAPADACRVTDDGGLLALAKTDGAQRPAGRLYADGNMRMIFLGTMRMADERRALDYGRDLGRNMAGILERIGPQRWRLVLPFPQWGSTLEVVELAPAG